MKAVGGVALTSDIQAEPSDAGWRALLAQEVHCGSHLCFALAHRILRDRAAAEDVCQQAFLKAWEFRHHINSGQALRGWLLRVVTNESLQILRRKRAEERVPAHIGRPEAAVSVSERQVALRESVLLALADLPETTRTVVVLRVMGGRSGNEVKAMLGCSAAEVSRRLHEGLEMLKGSMSDWSGLDGFSEGSGDRGSAIFPQERQP